MRHSRKTCHNYAQGYPVGEEDPGRAGLDSVDGDKRWRLIAIPHRRSYIVLNVKTLS